MHKILDILIPRFITEDVALADNDGVLTPICSTKDLDAWDCPDAVMTFKSFNLFGFAIFCRPVGEPREWKP